MDRRLKTILVVVGAIVTSSVAIQASDVLEGVGGNMLGSVIERDGPCGAGAVLHQLGATTICVDEFEASPGTDCPASVVQNENQTRQNLLNDTCGAVSVADATPWRFVSLTQAQQLCAREGKRLPSNEEWYKLSLGVRNIDACAIGVTTDGLQPTGKSGCVSPTGVHDLIGNVWEWVDEEVRDGVYNERALPESGYVSLVDSTGVALETTLIPQAEYGEDYIWSNQSGVYGMIRGGFHGSQSDAGLYSFNAAVPLDFKASGVGFRCVRDIW